MLEPVVRARKGHGFSLASRALIRKRRLERFAMTKKTLRRRRKQKLRAEFQTLLDRGEPINRAYMDKHHRALVQSTLRFSGTYQKFVEDVLGLDYSKVAVPFDEMVKRNRVQGRALVARRTPKENIQTRRNLTRGHLWKNQKIHMIKMQKILAFRLQGHSLKSIGLKVNYSFDTVDDFLSEVRKLADSDLRARLSEISQASLRAHNARKLCEGPILQSPEANAMARAFVLQLTHQFQERYRTVQDLAVKGVWPSDAAKQTGIHLSEVLRLINMFPEKTFQRHLRAKFRMRAKVHARASSESALVPTVA